MKKQTVKKPGNIKADDPGKKAIDEENYNDDTSLLDDDIEPEIIDEEGISTFDDDED